MDIEINLADPNTFKEAQNAIKKYASELEEKARYLTQLVSYKLAGEVGNNFSRAIYDVIVPVGGTTPNVSVAVKTGKNFMVVIAQGKEAIFVEFGAGVYFNGGGSPHPNGAKFGYTIGSYTDDKGRNKGNGLKEIWGFYDENGELILTRGTPAQMPMYHAMETIVKEVATLAKEVFAL